MADDQAAEAAAAPTDLPVAPSDLSTPDNGAPPAGAATDPPPTATEPAAGGAAAGDAAKEAEPAAEADAHPPAMEVEASVGSTDATEHAPAPDGNLPNDAVDAAASDAMETDPAVTEQPPATGTAESSQPAADTAMQPPTPQQMGAEAPGFFIDKTGDPANAAAATADPGEAGSTLIKPPPPLPSALSAPPPGGPNSKPRAAAAATDSGAGGKSPPRSDRRDSTRRRGRESVGEKESRKRERSPPPNSRLFLGNLASERVSKRELEERFGKYGTVLEVSMHPSFGFVQFDNPDSAKAAIEHENRKAIAGMTIDISLATNRGAPKKKGPPPPSARDRDTDKLRCIDFDRGKCRRGDQCRYLHALPARDRDDRRDDRRGPPPRGHDRRLSPPPRDRRRDRDAPLGRPEKRGRTGPPDVEVVVPTSQPAALDFADVVGKSLADVGLQVGKTVMQRGQEMRGLLASMAANGVLYVCVIDEIRGVRGTMTIKFLYRNNAEDLYNVLLAEAVGIIQRDHDQMQSRGGVPPPGGGGGRHPPPARDFGGPPPRGMAPPRQDMPPPRDFGGGGHPPGGHPPPHSTGGPAQYPPQRGGGGPAMRYPSDAPPGGYGGGGGGGGPHPGPAGGGGGGAGAPGTADLTKKIYSLIDGQGGGGRQAERYPPAAQGGMDPRRGPGPGPGYHDPQPPYGAQPSPAQRPPEGDPRYPNQGPPSGDYGRGGAPLGGGGPPPQQQQQQQGQGQYGHPPSHQPHTPGGPAMGGGGAMDYSQSMQYPPSAGGSGGGGGPMGGGMGGGDPRYGGGGGGGGGASGGGQYGAPTTDSGRYGSQSMGDPRAMDVDPRFSGGGGGGGGGPQHQGMPQGGGYGGGPADGGGGGGGGAYGMDRRGPPMDQGQQYGSQRQHQGFGQPPGGGPQSGGRYSQQQQQQATLAPNGPSDMETLLSNPDAQKALAELLATPDVLKELTRRS